VGGLAAGNFEDDVAYLIDFGIARTAGDMALTTAGG
jgi:hypothetical protein